MLDENLQLWIMLSKSNFPKNRESFPMSPFISFPPFKGLMAEAYDSKFNII
jgi:hypothetical protein